MKIRSEEEITEDLKNLRMLIVDEVVEKLYPELTWRSKDDIDYVMSLTEKSSWQNLELNVREALKVETLPNLHQDDLFLAVKKGMVYTLTGYANPTNRRALYQKEIKALDDFIKMVNDDSADYPELFDSYYMNPVESILVLGSEKDKLMTVRFLNRMFTIETETLDELIDYHNLSPSAYVGAIKKLTVHYQEEFRKLRHPDYYLMKDELFKQINEVGQVAITPFEHDTDSKFTSSWLGCYTISKSDYERYNIEELGVEGDHLPYRLDEQWHEIHLHELKTKKELELKQAKQEIKPKKQKSQELRRL